MYLIIDIYTDKKIYVNTRLYLELKVVGLSKKEIYKKSIKYLKNLSLKEVENVTKPKHILKFEHMIKEIVKKLKSNKEYGFIEDIGAIEYRFIENEPYKNYLII